MGLTGIWALVGTAVLASSIKRVTADDWFYSQRINGSAKWTACGYYTLRHWVWCTNGTMTAYISSEAQCSASSYYTCPAERGYEPMRCTVASDCARAWSGSSDNSQKLCLVMMPGNTTNATCDVRIAGTTTPKANEPVLTTWQIIAIALGGAAVLIGTCLITGVIVWCTCWRHRRNKVMDPGAGIASVQDAYDTYGKAVLGTGSPMQTAALSTMHVGTRGFTMPCHVLAATSAPLKAFPQLYGSVDPNQYTPSGTPTINGRRMYAPLVASPGMNAVGQSASMGQQAPGFGTDPWVGQGMAAAMPQTMGLPGSVDAPAGPMGQLGLASAAPTDLHSMHAQSTPGPAQGLVPQPDMQAHVQARAMVGPRQHAVQGMGHVPMPGPMTAGAASQTTPDVVGLAAAAAAGTLSPLGQPIQGSLLLPAPQQPLQPPLLQPLQPSHSQHHPPEQAVGPVGMAVAPHALPPVPQEFVQAAHGPAPLTSLPGSGHQAEPDPLLDPESTLKKPGAAEQLARMGLSPVAASAGSGPFQGGTRSMQLPSQGALAGPLVEPDQAAHFPEAKHQLERMGLVQGMSVPQAMPPVHAQMPQTAGQGTWQEDAVGGGAAAAPASNQSILTAAAGSCPAALPDQMLALAVEAGGLTAAGQQQAGLLPLPQSQQTAPSPLLQPSHPLNALRPLGGGLQPMSGGLQPMSGGLQPLLPHGGGLLQPLQPEGPLSGAPPLGPLSGAPPLGRSASKSRAQASEPFGPTAAESQTSAQASQASAGGLSLLGPSQGQAGNGLIAGAGQLGLGSLGVGAPTRVSGNGAEAASGNIVQVSPYGGGGGGGLLALPLGQSMGQTEVSAAMRGTELGLGQMQRQVLQQPQQQLLPTQQEVSQRQQRPQPGKHADVDGEMDDLEEELLS